MKRKVTALKAQKRNQQRVSVFLDGEFAFGLARIVAAWLQVGQEIDEEKIAALQAEDALETAYQRALKFCSYRMRTESEVLQNLKEHDVPEEIVAKVLERLRQSGLVDDQRFAQAWVENRNEFRPRGRRALAMELRQKGVADGVIADTLVEIDEDELAYQVACKQVRKYLHLDRPEFRRKMSGFLARRGFSYDIILPVLDRVWAERDLST